MTGTRDDIVGRTSMPGDSGAGWALPAGEVHVWQASLERPSQMVQSMRALLAPDERRRADRYRFERHRARYIVGRALLRRLLAHYVQASPEKLEFRYGEFDKPALARGPWFNLSHSGSVALYAFSSAEEVGIDVEIYDESFASEHIAERFFSPSEVSVLRSLPAELQPRAFLTCWTRKEAFIKARGDGLSLALDSFDVTLAPDAPAALLRTEWSSEEPGQWQIEDLSDPGGGYLAAVAIRAYESPVIKRYSVDTIDPVEGGMPGQEK